MTSAIMLAGSNSARAIREYARTVAKYYGETFVETGYKPLRTFEVLRKGMLVRLPLIQFTLERLLDSDEIDDIIIVGQKARLEERLQGLLRGFDKPCRIIDQRAPIAPEVIDRFGIVPRKVPPGSIAGNIIQGYAASRAYEGRRHALFAASDAPFTSLPFIEYVLRLGKRHEGQYAIIAPAVLLGRNVDRFGRPPLKLVNDSSLKEAEHKDRHGRQRFRASSVIYADPHGFDINSVNSAYSLRKGLSPRVQLKLFRITRRLGYPNIYSKYFVSKDLSITEAENIASAYFDGQLKIVPVRDVESSYDYDGTDQELRNVSGMLKTEH
jgi:spore coat polysaccharide biosynthesis protein SpsF (cytidylyltransferase family)